MHAQTRAAVAIVQRIGDEPRAKIGTADAHAHHIGDAGSHQRIHHRRHLRARSARLRRGVADVGDIGQIAAQRGVQRGAAFGGVDEMTVEQPAHCRREVGRFGDGEQRIQRRTIVMLPREIRVERTDAQRECVRALRVFGDQSGDRHLPQSLGMRRQRFKHGVVRVGHVGLAGAVSELPQSCQIGAASPLQTKSTSQCVGCQESSNSRLSIKRVRPSRAAISATRGPGTT